MLTKTQLKILAYLIDHKEKLIGIRELAKEISVVYYLVQRNIQQLNNMKVINLQKAGKTLVIRLNEDDEAEHLVEAENYKKKEFFLKFPELKVILNKIIRENSYSFFIILVFGSYAKINIKLRKDSDLDLLIIVPDEKYEERIEKTISSVSRISPVKIHGTIVSEESFISILKKKELNVATEAKNNHVIIYGGENYYKLLKD